MFVTVNGEVHELNGILSDLATQINWNTEQICNMQAQMLDLGEQVLELVKQLRNE